MNRLISLSVLTLLVGCTPRDAPSIVLVDESIPINEEHFGARALPRYIPEGTQYQVPAVGFEDSDGTFYPVLALCNPVPRGGSVEPIRLSNRRLKVFRGSDPIAANNELLGVYEVDSAVNEFQIGFSVTHDGQLHLAITDPISGENLTVTRLPPVTAAIDPESATLTAQNPPLANHAM